ncbi:MAG: hypothetical protein EP330_21340 [Deltaproteobacteria bacterium]|nr:MAG: hypothetical protein EP330_21340 [Deltaproteobacteria bacterium]
MRLLPFFLLACAGSSEDTSAPDRDLVMAPPAFTPEIGEVAEYGVLFVGELPDRVEWTVDGELVEFANLTGETRYDLSLETPSTAFTVAVEAFYGMDSVSASLDVDAVPNTAPVITLVEPASGTATAGKLLALVADVADRTAPVTTCRWDVDGTTVAEGELTDTSFSAAWFTEVGTATATIGCTDKLGESASQSVIVEVQ